MKGPKPYTPYRVLIGAQTSNSGGTIAVALRRLANPYLPFNGNRNTLTYNPYITVDYVEPITVSSVDGYSGGWSTGKLQPYAAHRSQLVLQNINTTRGGY